MPHDNSATLNDWIQKWKLDPYEIDTLVSTEGAHFDAPTPGELRWRANLKQLARQQSLYAHKEVQI